MDPSTWIFGLAGAGLGASVTYAACRWRARLAPDQAKQGDLPLERVLDALDESVMVIGEDRVVRLANEASHRFFPQAGTIVRRRLLPVVLDARLDDLVGRCFAGGADEVLEFKGGADGDAVWVAVATLMEGVAGDERMVRLMIRDDTERARTEQIRQEFVANASHELRTPLTIIQGYLENLLDGDLENAELARRFLRTSRKHAQRLTRLVEDMLSISKLESGEYGVLKRKSFSLKKCLIRVVDNLHPLIEHGGATVDYEVEDGVSRLVGDRFYWEQIFFNLIENALKNNPAPGLTVRVTARRVADGGAEMVVEDDGVGIPKAALPFIFKRFYRVSQGGGPEIPGTGLGLSIVKRAVEAHDGSVEVDSQPGMRTRFTIRLPQERVEAQAHLTKSS